MPVEDAVAVEAEDVAGVCELEELRGVVDFAEVVDLSAVDLSAVDLPAVLLSAVFLSAVGLCTVGFWLPAVCRDLAENFEDDPREFEDFLVSVDGRAPDDAVGEVPDIGRDCSRDSRCGARRAGRGCVSAERF